MAKLPKPEKTLIKFIERCWMPKRFDRAVKYIQRTWAHENRNTIESRLNSMFVHIDVIEYGIKEVIPVTKVVKDIVFWIKLGDGTIRTLKARLICEKYPYKPTIHGKWGINPPSITRGLY